MRDFLKQLNVIPGLGGVPSISADEARLDVFLKTHDQGPDMAYCVPHYAAPSVTRSLWNKELAFVLSQQFKHEVLQGLWPAVKYDPTTKTFTPAFAKGLEKAILKRFDGPGASYKRAQAGILAEHKAAKAVQDQAYSRRDGVSLASPYQQPELNILIRLGGAADNKLLRDSSRQHRWRCLLTSSQLGTRSRYFISYSARTVSAKMSLVTKRLPLVSGYLVVASCDALGYRGWLSRSPTSGKRSSYQLVLCLRREGIV